MPSCSPHRCAASLPRAQGSSRCSDRINSSVLQVRARQAGLRPAWAEAMPPPAPGEEQPRVPAGAGAAWLRSAGPFAAAFCAPPALSFLFKTSWLMLLNGLHTAVRRSAQQGPTARGCSRGRRPEPADPVHAGAGESGRAGCAGEAGWRGLSSPRKLSQRVLDGCAALPGVVRSCLEPRAVLDPVGSGRDGLPGVPSSPRSPCQGLSCLSAVSETS